MASDYLVRKYQDDDFNQVMGLYARKSPRVPSFERGADFVRHFLRYPGLEEGIFVATRGPVIDGLALVMIINNEELREGRLIEVRFETRAAFEALIQHALDYCQSNNVDRVSLRPPMYEGTEEVLRGWIKVDYAAMLIKPLNVESILLSFLNRDIIREHFSGRSFIFNVDEEKIRLEIFHDRLGIIPLEALPDRKLINITLSSTKLVELIFGWTNPYLSYLKNEIKINGLTNVPTTLTLFGLARVKSPWNVSMADEV